MRERSMIALAVLLLTLALAAGAVGVGSYSFEDRVYWTRARDSSGGRTEWVATSARGSLRLERRRVTTRVGGLRARVRSADDPPPGQGPKVWPDLWDEAPPAFRWEQSYPTGPPRWGRPRGGRGEEVLEAWSWRRFGFAMEHERRTQFSRAVGLSRDAIAVPHWLVALILAAPFVVTTLRRRRRNQRRRLGQCPRCGYDLRATPGRCPECGL